MRLAKDLRPGDTVVALSLWEPWATLMAIEAKRIETRDWFTSYRGPLLICAAKRYRKNELLDMLEEKFFREALADVWEGKGGHGLAFGKAVCLVDLVDCRPTHVLKRTQMVTAQEDAFGDFYPGRFGWVTERCRRLVPFPVTGQQGLFDVRLPEDMEDWL